MNSIIKKKYKIQGMKCSSCAFLIEGEVEELEGVQQSKANYARCEVDIEFNTDQVTEEVIIKTIKKAGYTAIPIDT